MRHTIPILLTSLLLAGCGDEPAGLRLSPAGSGPTVLFDLDARPLPEIPFPNDLATRPDPTAATGRRVNASMIAPTVLERVVRFQLDRLDGFGLSSPVTVRFDAPLDLDDLIRRHQGNTDFADDAVFLLPIDPAQRGFGEPVMLDMGRGNYPLELERSNRYFASDPRAEAGNVLFETVEEDLDGDGRLDPGEDTDGDGVLDHPNVWPPGTAPLDGLLTFYESETDTLLLRPVVPLRERTTYAVLLTERLRGRDGQPVRSPFRWVHHLQQTEALAALPAALERLRARGIALSLDELAFAWTFTTQSTTAELVAIREGLRGVGALGWLGAEFPPQAVPHRCKNEYQPPPFYLLEPERLIQMASVIAPAIFGVNLEEFQPLLDTFEHVAYIAAGSYQSPDFMRAGADARPHDEVFDIDLAAGRAEVQPAEVYFWAAIPKATAHHQPPYPVAIYAHGYSSARFELLGFAGTLARYGIASIGIDAWGHGAPLEPEWIELLLSVAEGWGVDPFAETVLQGRSRDLTGDGVVDSGGDFWTGYAFHTRDAVRQTIVDHFQLVRVLQAFDGLNTWALDQDGDGRDDLAGDFDGDGTVDLGGPGLPIFAWGQSMGGIVSAVLGPLEPAIVAAAPTSGGGMLGDVGMRTQLGAVRNAVMLRSLGPLVVAEPNGDGTLRLSLRVPLAAEERRLPIAAAVPAPAGGSLCVTDETRAETKCAPLADGPRGRVGLAADQGDRFTLSLRDAAGAEATRLERWETDVWYRDDAAFALAGDPLSMPTEGFGMDRCTPDLRRMVGLFQAIMEPADPASYGRHWWAEPLLIRPEGPSVTNLLEIATVGDQEVPINAQLAIARAAGLLQTAEPDARYGMSENDWLIERRVYEGLDGRGRYPAPDLLFDPDDLDEGRDGFGNPEPTAGQRLRARVDTATGVSALRLAYLDPRGQHGFFIPSPHKSFDADSYLANLIAHFYATLGRVVLDDACLETASCELP